MTKVFCGLIAATVVLFFPLPGVAQNSDAAALQEAENTGYCGELPVHFAYYEEDGSLMFFCSGPLIDLNPSSDVPFQPEGTEGPINSERWLSQ